MTTRDIVFALLGVISAAGAVLAVTTRQLVHSALWLVVCLGTLAGCYVVLGAELVALVQANKEKNTNVIVLREGKPLNLAIAGKARKVEETANAAKYLLYNNRFRAADSLGSTLNYTNSTGTTLGTPEPTFGTPGWKSATSMGNMVANPKRIAPPQDAIDLRAKIDQIDKSLKALNRIENLENEIKSLHEALEKINETLKKR